jgi:HAMP domain-containing protein
LHEKIDLLRSQEVAELAQAVRELAAEIRRDREAA